MIFSDLNALNEIIAITIRTNSKYHDDNDPEIDRFLNSSPTINESMLQASYEYESMRNYQARQNAMGATNDKPYIYDDSGNITQQKPNDTNNSNSTKTNNNITTKNTPLTFTTAKIPQKNDLKKLNL